MTIRSTRKPVTFSAPFRLTGFEELLSACTYVVETDEEVLEGQAHTGFRRIATTMRIRTGATIEHHQIDPRELEAALQRDQDAARDKLISADQLSRQSRRSDNSPPADWRWVPLWVRNTPSHRRS